MATYNGHNEDSSGNILLSIGNGMAATVETGSTASQAYTKGALLFFNNRLCKATQAISSGATLAVGTNLSQTSLGAELTSHLRSSDGKEFYFDVKDGTYGYYPSASKVSDEFVPFGGTFLGANEYALTTAYKSSGGTSELGTYSSGTAITVSYGYSACFIANVQGKSGTLSHHSGGNTVLQYCTIKNNKIASSDFYTSASTHSISFSNVDYIIVFDQAAGSISHSFTINLN